MIRSTLARSIAWTFCLASVATASAASSDNAMAQLEAIMADESQREASYEAGHERITFCGYCHGEDGNSKRDYIPNLAGQHPRYLFEQFEKFGDGTREDYVMSRLAKTLSLEERINIAIYYGQQTAKPRPGGDPALQKAGQRLFESRCTVCHGDSAQGQKNMPRLASQPAEYLENALKRFQGLDPAKDPSPMIGIASGLTEKNIRELAVFLQGVGGE